MPRTGSARIVYVIDGNASVREGLTRLMDSAGLEARPCASVAEFLQQARGLRASCVLLDVDVVRECEAGLVETLHHVASILPFIALSSSDNPAARRSARELGAQSFFHKPVDSAALLDSIEWVMQGDGRVPPH